MELYLCETDSPGRLRCYSFSLLLPERILCGDIEKCGNSSRVSALVRRHILRRTSSSLVTEMGHLARALSLSLFLSPALIDARAFSRTRRARGRSRLPDKLCKRNFPIVPPHLPPSPRCVAPYARILPAWKRMLRFVPQTAAYFNILPLCIMHVRADRFALTARPLTASFNSRCVRGGTPRDNVDRRHPC